MLLRLAIVVVAAVAEALAVLTVMPPAAVKIDTHSHHFAFLVD